MRICKLFHNKGDTANVKITENTENLPYGDKGAKISYGIKKKRETSITLRTL